MTPNNFGIRSLPMMTAYPMSSLLSSYASLAVSERAKTASFIHKMNWERAIDTSHTVLGMGMDSNYAGERSKAVRGAWQYERERIRRGFKTSRPFTDDQKGNIAKYGKLRASEGYPEATVHHSKNVHNHPLEQANPDNTKICITTREHVDAHGGNYRNETNTPFKKDWQNKDLIKQTERRIDRAEIKSMGFMALMSFVTASSITFIVELYRNGSSRENLQEATKSALESGRDAVSITLLSYAIANKVLEPATSKISEILIKNGFKVSSDAVKTGVIGAIIIIVSAAYIYLNLRAGGYTPRQALVSVAKQAAVSVILLIVEVWVIGKYGGLAGLVFSLFATLFLLVYSLYSIHVDKELRLRIVYAIEDHQYRLALSDCA